MRRHKLKINNKLKKGILGQMDPKTNRIEINVRAHKGDKANLASTIKHELMHVNQPHKTEKEVYKATAKTKIPPMEQHKLIAKLRSKKIGNAQGALKRKFKMNPNEKVEPGSFISKMNSQKSIKRGNPSLQKIEIMGIM